MNSVDTFHKRLRDEIAAVEKEIQSHNQQVESLTKRLEGLKRAGELFESDQAAIAELLQTSIANGGGITREMASAGRHDAKSGGQPKRRRGRKRSSGAALKSAEAKCRLDAPLRATTAGSRALT